MTDIIYLDHSQAFDRELIQSLQSKGKDVRTYCCAMLGSDRSDFYRGSKEECLQEARRNPPYDAVLELTFFHTFATIERIFWLDKEGRIQAEETVDAYE